MTDNIVETSSILKKYKNVTALNDVSITVRRGEIYGLIGDNGAGKTTFLKMLTGQSFPTGGEVKLFGQHYERELEKVRKRTGAMIESPGFYPKLSVERHMEYYRIQRGIPGKEKVEEILKTVGLFEKRRAKCGNLSMGMKQRFGLGVALLGEPELLLLDEPINGLDPSGIIEMRSLLLKLNRDKHITIILSSHILSELEQIATVFGFLSRGWLLEEVTTEALHERCAGYIQITVNEPEKYAVMFEKEMKGETYQIMPDSSIRIRNPHRPAEAYSGLAAKHGIGILNFEQKQRSLEEYYMSLKERGRLSC